MKIAVVSALGIGDGLIASVLTHNLALNNYETYLYSSPLVALQSWFPFQKILPFPSVESDYFSYDLVIGMDYSPVCQLKEREFPCIILKHKELDKSKTLVENLQEVCQNYFNITNPTRENGIVPPSFLQHRKNKETVFLHPSSLDQKKCWPTEKFLSLALVLKSEGLSPHFCIGPNEIDQWHSIQSAFPWVSIIKSPTLHELGCQLYESGWLIGNDSGLGHLASSLHIPTLSLFARESCSRFWRPGWGLNQVVIPPRLTIGATFKQRHWKQLLTVKRVAKAFKNLKEKIK